MNDYDSLSLREITFAQEYVLCLHGAKAAIKAGYKKSNARSTASTMLAKSKIQRYVNELKRQRSVKTQITSEYVLTGIRDIFEKAKNLGNDMIAIKAAELLGKHLKLFTEVHEVNGTITHMGSVTLVDKTGKEAPLMLKVGQPANPHPQLH